MIHQDKKREKKLKQVHEMIEEQLEYDRKINKLCDKGLRMTARKIKRVDKKIRKAEEKLKKKKNKRLVKKLDKLRVKRLMLRDIERSLNSVKEQVLKELVLLKHEDSKFRDIKYLKRGMKIEFDTGAKEKQDIAELFKEIMVLKSLKQRAKK